MTPQEDLRRFVALGIRDLGGIAEEPDVRTLNLVVPEALHDTLGADYLSLDTEDGTLTAGSPIVEAVAQALSGEGCAARSYLNPVYLQGGDLQAKWERTFRFAGGRAALLSQTLEETIHAMFHFRASFLTDEREERLYPVAVNLTTRLPYDALLEEWPRLFPDEASAYGELPGVPAPELADLKPALKAALKRRMTADIEGAQRTQEKFLTRESRRLDDYYGALEVELAERGRRPLTEGQAERLAERRRALALDRARKTRDAVEKHRLRIEVKAVALNLIHQPWLRVTMRLENRRESLDHPFFWNPALKSFAPAACGACGGELSSLSLREARVVCPVCAGC